MLTEHFRQISVQHGTMQYTNKQTCRPTIIPTNTLEQISGDKINPSKRASAMSFNCLESLKNILGHKEYLKMNVQPIIFFSRPFKMVLNSLNDPQQSLSVTVKAPCLSVVPISSGTVFKKK